MKNFFLFLFSFLLIGLFSCSDDKTSDTNDGTPYDPSKPIVLTDFIPEKGGMAQQVILRGSNFGTDVSKLKVYFNQKQAKVIKSKGDLAYVITPRLPGDTCVISLVVGNDSLTYEDPFYYETKVRISTISGVKGDKQTVDGTLAEGRFDNPYFIVVDKEKNILVGEYMARARLLNEERNSVQTLISTSTSGEIVSGCTDHNNEVIFYPMNNMPYYYEFDPEQQWTPRRRNIIRAPGHEFEVNGKYSFAVSELDSMIYCITTKAELIKINPKTQTGYLIMNGILSDRITSKFQAYLAFHPINKHMLYFVNPSSMKPQDGPIVGTDRIYRINLNTLVIEDYAGTGVKGHQDGRKELAQFNNPCQICFDHDANLYVGDTDNFCVRMITPEGIVTTIAGIPGKNGYLDGDPDDALLDRFWGMKIDPDGTLYIADYYNHSIRKLTIQ